MTPEELREGIFNLSQSRFGSITQTLIKRMVSLKKNRDSLADLYQVFSGKKVEIKCTTARIKTTRAISEATLLSCIEDALPHNRSVSFDKWTECDFECKIQQVKPNKFDVLCYGVFFLDRFLIFVIDSKDIESRVEYTPGEGVGSNSGGVFYLNQKTLQTHLKFFLKKNISYQELLDLI